MRKYVCIFVEKKNWFEKHARNCQKNFCFVYRCPESQKVIIIKGKDVKNMLRRVYGTRLVKVGTFIVKLTSWRFSGEGQENEWEQSKIKLTSKTKVQ